MLVILGELSVNILYRWNGELAIDNLQMTMVEMLMYDYFPFIGISCSAENVKTWSTHSLVNLLTK